MLESWTIQKLLDSPTIFKDNIRILQSLRIEARELKTGPLFQVKLWWQYCSCGCDKYTPRIRIKDELMTCYHCIKNYNERKKLGLVN